jgi:hypothetical protein
MTLKRTTIIFVVGAALAAWFSSAMTPGRPPAVPQRFTRDRADTHGVALAAEIGRLRERLGPEATPRAGARNLFAFRSSVAAAHRAAPSARSAATAAHASDQPPMRLALSGIAEDPAGDGNGVARTAIIAGNGQLFLARPGDTVTDQDVVYTVGTVLADSVELIDARDGSTRRLALR